MNSHEALLKRINIERVKEGKAIIVQYGKTEIIGWSRCLKCRKDTNQLTIFDNEAERKGGLCLLCKSVNVDWI